MSLWRPAQSIRVKALGLVWRNGRLLASEVYRDTGQVKGVRPLGGSLEFGETAEQAVIREFQEELDVTVTVAAPPRVFENLYTHEGAQGHEVLFLFEVSLPEGAFAGQEFIVFKEDSGVECVARWYDVQTLDLPGAPELYPTGLKEFLRT